MRILISSFALALALATAQSALAASKWGLTGEEEVRFDGEVVDVLAALTGNTAENCGGGARQLGVQKADGTIVLTVKNSVNFSGTSHELVEFCGQQVTVDGLIAGPPDNRVMVVQFVRPKGGEWRKTNRSIGQYSRDGWAEANGYEPGGGEAKRWFANDKRVLNALDEDGFLGLGEEADQKFLEEW